MADRVAPCAAAAPAAHVCVKCSKTFSRVCDLNKHMKCHSRPYKCKETGCKYHVFGWPTAKELERHYNDKHSENPRVFPCQFQPCPYSSKRESNCKQHMEKAHNWTYVRSKAKGKRSAAHPKAGDGDQTSPSDCGLTLEADRNTPATSASPRSLMEHPRSADFILYDDDQVDAIGDVDDPSYPLYDTTPCSKSYVPWLSPDTRLRRNESLIETFSQTYNGSQENMSTVDTTGRTGLVSDLSNYTLQVQNYPQVESHGQFVGEPAVKVEPPVLTVDTSVSMKQRFKPAEAPFTDQKQSTSSATHVRPDSGRDPRTGRGVPSPSKRRAGSKHRGSTGEEGCPPKKKAKANPAEGFTDSSMPDIYRQAHPHIYDKELADKYSPCHTVHRNISTLVRHLGRPAHRLKVTKRAVSSFDIEDPEFRHPQVGVCRNCWQTFDQRPAFDAHVSRPCQTVSKGKREKWRVLYESFTPLLGPSDATFGNPGSTQLSEEAWGIVSSCQDDSAGNHVFDDAGTPPTSVPSPIISDSTDIYPLIPATGQLVTAQEHLRLQREHQALRERHQQLERMTKALLIQRIFQNLKHGAASEPDVQPPTVSSSDAIRPGTWPTLSDQDSLVQHMDSQSTDVDVHAFTKEMEEWEETEENRQPLCRMDSGLSSASRSTIHHVPPSPPPSRPAELPDAAKFGREVSHQHPPPSIPDSGYGTEQRPASLGDLPTDPSKLQQQQQPQVTPLLTAAETTPRQEYQKPSDALPWETSPTAMGTPQGNTSQPAGFLPDQDMTDYAMEPLSPYSFFQDNMVQLQRGLASSSSPPPDFSSFEFSS